MIQYFQSKPFSSSLSSEHSPCFVVFSWPSYNRQSLIRIDNYRWRMCHYSRSSLSYLMTLPGRCRLRIWQFGDESCGSLWSKNSKSQYNSAGELAMYCCRHVDPLRFFSSLCLPVCSTFDYSDEESDHALCTKLSSNSLSHSNCEASLVGEHYLSG